MFNQPCSAQSAAEYLKKEQERELQPKIQIAELHRHTEILSEVNELIKINSEQVKQLVECTKQNLISTDIQAKASNRLAKTAIWISIFALIINIIQIFR